MINVLTRYGEVDALGNYCSLLISGEGDFVARIWVSSTVSWIRNFRGSWALSPHGSGTKSLRVELRFLSAQLSSSSFFPFSLVSEQLLDELSFLCWWCWRQLSRSLVLVEEEDDSFSYFFPESSWTSWAAAHTLMLSLIHGAPLLYSVPSSPLLLLHSKLQQKVGDTRCYLRIVTACLVKFAKFQGNQLTWL